MPNDELIDRLFELSEHDQRYELGPLLGHGGSGAVHQLLDRKLARFVAGKRLIEPLASHSEERARLAREAWITAQLDHPNIAPVHDVAVDPNGELCLVSKLIRGRPFSQVLLESRQTDAAPHVSRAHLQIVLSVCDALEYAHARGVVHRDLKPDNIMVGHHNEVFLMDWGNAKILREGASQDPDAVRASQTLQQHRRPEDETAGAAVCTPSYAAPEQIFGVHAQIDVRTDVFGVGATLHEVAVGTPPFAEELPGRGMAKAGKPFDPSSLRGVHPRLSSIVFKALSYEREDRYPTIGELRRDLAQFLDSGWAFERRLARKGELIIAEGDPAREIYVIVEGLCSAFKTVDGIARTLRQMSSGDVFGETGVFGDGRRTASVRADADTVLAIISRDELDSELQRNFWVSLPVRALARRFVQVDAKATELERRYEALRWLGAWLAAHGERDPAGRFSAPCRACAAAWQRSLGLPEDGDTAWLFERLAQTFGPAEAGAEGSSRFGPIAVDGANRRLWLHGDAP